MYYAILNNGNILRSENNKICKFTSKTAVKKEISTLNAIKEGRVDSINMEIGFIFNEIEFRRNSISQMQILDESKYKRSIARVKGIITILEKKVSVLNKKIDEIERSTYAAIQFV